MGADMPVVKSAVVAARDFFGGLMAAVPDWQARLRKDPDQLQAIEQEVHALMAQGGDMVVCGLMSVAVRDPSLEAKQEACRENFSYRLDRGRDRRVRVRLLGGLAVWMCALYCQPKRRSSQRDEAQPGVHLDGRIVRHR